MMQCNDQPGRVCAVVCFAPIHLIGAIFLLIDNSTTGIPVAIYMICFAIVLFLWDLYWLCFKSPRESVIFDLVSPSDNENICAETVDFHDS
jgi:hypothetical protein